MEKYEEKLADVQKKVQEPVHPQDYRIKKFMGIFAETESA